ncbi:nuclear transport factor 2 family protein [Promicromonospora sp. MEB111]|uniref:nuclear transport factor 2 family protein n=1 Tax=unclassified Promicromonospora TaxID=2647929 RepID=UPI00254CC4D5|nr:nuclear transport factor 2 family protein [Promicromonospora sp. MEB111]
MIDTVQRLQDRIAIRELVDTYARGADRRDARLEASVFVDDGRVILFNGDPAHNDPLDEIEGRDRLAETFASLIRQYEATTYLNGQSTVSFVGDDEADGETYCIAFHILNDQGETFLVTMSIRYLDRFVRTSDGWRIATRRLIFDWTDTRPSKPSIT